MRTLTARRATGHDNHDNQDTHDNHDDPGCDRGAILVWFAVSIVTLIGSGALVVDVGALYHERRQLQNGADSAALAVAVDCANATCVDVQATAQAYANANAVDGATAIDEVCGQGPGLTACATPPAGSTDVPYHVQVRTSTRNPSNTRHPDQVQFHLAPVLSAAQVGATVHARTTVAWGALGSSDIVPLAISLCAFQQSGGIVAADGSLTFPRTQVTVIFYDPTTSSSEQSTGDCFGPGGQTVPGGFGWLAPTSPCQANIVLQPGGVLVPGDPGKSFEQTCKTQFETWASPGDDETFIIPLFDQATLTGSNSLYRVIALASFDVCGFRFPGISNNGTECRATCSGPNNTGYLCGYFQPAVVSDGTMISGSDYGTRVMKVVG